MKKISIAIILLYSIIFIIYPNQNHIPQPQVQKDPHKVALPYQNGFIELNIYKEDSSERRWGKVNGYQFMIYKGIDKYIYVNGSFYDVRGTWDNNSFLILENDAKRLFGLTGSKGSYTSKQLPNSSVCEDITTEEVLKRLEIPHIPISNSMITREPGQLPGANRDYRNGKHEGFDWYAGAIGIEITRDTTVHPIFDGKIVRVDKNYTELEPDYRNSLLDEAAKNKNTPQSTLDKLRGRQVWVQSENGILVHYAHLSSVNSTLKVGDTVKVSDWLGKVGNSGTSNGALKTDDDLHLHSDILVCGKNFWEYEDVNVMNESLIEIFEKQTLKHNSKN